MHGDGVHNQDIMEGFDTLHLGIFIVDVSHYNILYTEGLHS